MDNSGRLERSRWRGGPAGWWTSRGNRDADQGIVTMGEANTC
jgi:hypothetical protein